MMITTGFSFTPLSVLSEGLCNSFTDNKNYSSYQTQKQSMQTIFASEKSRPEIISSYYTSIVGDAYAQKLATQHPANA
jgi:hypothetical protein